MTTLAVVLAGGSGHRAALGRNKALALLDGRTILQRSLDALVPHVDRVVVVARAADRAAIEAEVGDEVPVVDGGTTRHDSERAGLAAAGPDVDVVAFHDAARPLVDAAVVTAVLTAAAGGAAVVPALPRPVPLAIWPPDVDGGVLNDARLVPRAGLVGVQTPQAAPADVLRAAFAAAVAADEPPAGQLDTVEPVLRHRPDVPVLVVPGSARNIKVTWPRDLDVAQRLLAQPTLQPSPLRLRHRIGRPTGGRPFAAIEVDGVVPVTDALRQVVDGHVVAAVDRTHLVDVTGDLLAVDGVLDEGLADLADAVEAAVEAGAGLRLRRRR